MRHLSSVGRIGILAPPWLALPPDAYGGIEAVVALLSERLAERGHDVVLVAAPGSRVAGVDLRTPLGDLPDEIGRAGPELLHTLAALDALEGCDVILEHAGPIAALLASAHLRAPVLHVTHGPISGESLAVYRAILPRARGLRLIALSRAQWDAAPDLPFAAVCPNGIDLDRVPFCERPGDYLAFLGRMAPEKGVEEAIAIARRSGRQLRIAAKCREPAERRYFERAVAPHLGDDVVWLGELGFDDKLALLAGAAALAFPISWPEPFGMVMIEAMACGTPVLATPCGSVPEIVADGVTGFVRADLPDLAAAVGQVGELDRSACRAHVAERFSADAMADAYERVMVSALHERRPARIARA
jgi:glycosyltransferase involved in cell wall biosynthesis